MKHLKVCQNYSSGVIFSTLFSVFRLVMKHCISCLMYYLNSIVNSFINKKRLMQFPVTSLSYDFYCLGHPKSIKKHFPGHPFKAEENSRMFQGLAMKFKNFLRKYQFKTSELKNVEKLVEQSLKSCQNGLGMCIFVQSVKLHSWQGVLENLISLKSPGKILTKMVAIFCMKPGFVVYIFLCIDLFPYRKLNIFSASMANHLNFWHCLLMTSSRKV